MKIGRCRSCGKFIEWVKTTKGKNMPCDPEVLSHDEMNNGDVLVTLGGHVQRVDRSKSFPSLRGRVSHFATCPNANEWRRE